MTWAPRPGESVVAALAGLAMTAVGFTVDPTGRWLVWGAAALLFGIAATDLLVRPRLHADVSGMTVRSLTGQTVAPWSQTALGVRRLQRLGRSVVTLELDVDDKLIILGRRELGADPEQVLTQLIDIRDGAEAQ